MRARLRIDESLGEARVFHAEVIDWRGHWGKFDELGGHRTQLDLLTEVVLGLVGDIAERAGSIDERQPIGDVYDECRRQDRKLLHARRLWQWYADKFDQRVGCDNVQKRTLVAADEVIWSCWKTAFTALGEDMPAAPIAYLDAEYTASATPRSDFPRGLRPGADDLLKKHLEQLPLPVVGLPPVCCHRPWWLILAAHETSHHLQFEVPNLQERTREALAAAIGKPHVTTWLPWHRELFADACSVLLVGPSAIWAVRELETRNARGMHVSSASTYPPPSVRLAILNAVATQAGLPDGQFAIEREETSEELRESDEPESNVSELLARVPVVATALLDLTLPKGRSLRVIGEQTDPGLIARWCAALSGPDKPVAHPSLDAARLCIAAGVVAWQGLASNEDIREPRERLAGHLRGILPLCREPGKRATPTARPNAASIVRQFLTDMDEEGIRT